MKGFALLYSGNFLVETELSETQRLRVNIGLNPAVMQWNLLAGSEFQTPECVLVRSGEGIGGMSRVFHRLFTDRLMPPSWV